MKVTSSSNGTTVPAYAVLLIVKHDPKILINKIPKVMHTGHTEAINPLLFGAAISPRYMGTAVNDNPSTIPAINLAININKGDEAHAIKHQVKMKGMAEKMMSFFLPQISTSIAAKKDPRMAPNNGTMTNQEACSLVIVKV